MDDGGKRNWVQWHRSYDDPSSSLSRRLRVVQEQLRLALDERSGRVRIVSMCAGEGRDVIDVLRGHPRRSDVAARLVELNPQNAEAAREGAREAGLDQIEVVCADAAATDSYDGAVPADIVLACGVFGNISEEDIKRTIEYLPCLCSPNATVIWTRGSRPERDVAIEVRWWFNERGFEEIAFVAPAGERFRVGAHRLTAAPRALERGVSLFQFLR
jgi:hypothetical protein